MYVKEKVEILDNVTIEEVMSRIASGRIVIRLYKSNDLIRPIRMTLLNSCIANDLAVIIKNNEDSTLFISFG